MESVVKQIIFLYLDNYEDITNRINTLSNKDTKLTRFTIYGRIKLPIKFRLYKLDLLCYHGNNVTDDTVKYLVGIHTLFIDRNKTLTDIGMKYLTGIHTLKLTCNENITD